MAKAIEADSELAAMATYGSSGNESATVEALRVGIERFKSIVGTASDITAGIVNGIEERFKDMNFGETHRKMNNLNGLLGLKNKSDGIHHLGTVEELAQASVEMQRWIMAHSVLRKQYLENTIDGYSKSYIAPETEALGIDFYDYRRATDTIVMTEILELDDKPVETLQATTYFEDLLEGDVVLSIDDRFKIQATHESIDHLLANQCDDFTAISAILDGGQTMDNNVESTSSDGTGYSFYA